MSRKRWWRSLCLQRTDCDLLLVCKTTWIWDCVWFTESQLAAHWTSALMTLLSQGSCALRSSPSPHPNSPCPPFPGLLWPWCPAGRGCFGDLQAPADVVPRAWGPDGLQGPWRGVLPPGAAGQGRGAELQGTTWPRPGREEGTRTGPFVVQVPNNKKKLQDQKSDGQHDNCCYQSAHIQVTLFIKYVGRNYVCWFFKVTISIFTEDK